MKQLRATVALLGFFFGGCFALHSQEQESDWEVQSLTSQGGATYDFRTGIASGTNGVWVRYKDTELTADQVSVNQQTGESVAEGKVRIQSSGHIWAGEHIRYNFITHEMVADEFRSGRPPVFMEGKGLHGDITNRVYVARNALITTDDYAEPAIKIRATRIKIIPGRRVEAYNAVLYIAGVPLFYFPYYSRNFGPHANNFTFVPGYRTKFGPFLLNSYTWFLNDQIDGVVHLDYRVLRGVAGGPDFNYHLGRWGDGSIRYYYLHDEKPGVDIFNKSIPTDRQRVYFSYLGTPFTNMEIRSLVRYQEDPNIIRDFFEGEYRQNPQPNSFLEVNKFWRNFSLDVLAQPQINDFYETVERLPDVRLTGFRQQLWNTPLYYESESSLGYYRRRFAETNGPVMPHFSATRADTYHQLTIPKTLFGWLNFTPRAGGRLTYYSSATGPGATNSELYRAIFNTGAELSFKASQVWPNVHNSVFQVEGLRHIVEPSVNYVYVPAPNRRPDELPQFDYSLPSLRMLPIEFPGFNAIDSIDSQNVIRFGLRNKLQTKRGGETQDVLDWQLYMDWLLRPRSTQKTFGDLFSQMTFRPRSWMTFESYARYNINAELWRLSLNTLTLEPNNIWSWTIGHYYIRDDLSGLPTSFGVGNNLFFTSFYFRLNENWGLRVSEHFEARDGRLEEQNYSIYRDFRSWTGALSFRVRDSRNGSDDFTVAFTFSLKASPRQGLGSDTVRPYALFGQ